MTGASIEAFLSGADLIERLEVLMRKLEDEGRYVGSNTVWLAIEEIRRLRKGRGE